MPTDRRRFLQLSLYAAATGLLPSPGRSTGAIPVLTGAAKKNVLVIGAGLAGLVAAHELTKAGHDVTILEAQLRPGGRVLTVREPFSDGLYAEAGAARIPDNHDLTMHYVRQFGLPLVRFQPADRPRFLAVGGKRLRANANGDFDLAQVPLELTEEERRGGMSGLFGKYLAPALDSLGDPTAVDWPSGKAKAFDQLTAAQYLREQGASAGAIELLEWPWTTGAEDRISLLWLLRDLWYESTEKARYKIDGGNDRLPRAFAAGLKEKIRYGCPVVRIEQDSRKVRAVAVETGTHRTFEADRLICTVPFPALRKVDVRPAFSSSKRKAIAELTYDTITRVIFQCRRRFWEKEGISGFGVSDLPQEVWAPAFDQPGPRGLLVSFMCSEVAARVGAMDPDRRVQFVANAMERVHPGLLENLEGTYTKVWHADPWVGGGFALPSPGQLTSICIGIEKPEGRVHFAGEHTSRWTAWMQGALHSGLRAAKEVVDAA